MRGMGPPVSSLLAVQLDDELLGHGDLDVVAERQAAHGPLLLVGVDLQPLGHLAAARVQVVVQARHELRGRPQLDHVPHLHQVRRHRDLAAVHLEVAVRARRIVASLDGALVGEAAGALEEELHPLTATEPALRVAVPRHGRLLHPPPLRRAAPVVRNRRHVADRGDLEAHGLERADGGLAASPGPAHEDLDLLEPVLHRLARGDLGGRLRGERRALARAPEAGAPGARPGDDVAHPVGERDDRVIEGRLDVRDARADLAPLALLAALPPWCRLLLFGHSLRSCLPPSPCWSGPSGPRRNPGRAGGPRWLWLGVPPPPPLWPGGGPPPATLAIVALRFSPVRAPASPAQPFSSAGFARATPSGGRPRKGGNAPLRGLPLPCLVPGVLADDARHAPALDDLAVLAPRLDRRPHLHRSSVLARRPI